jgi:cell division protein FtsW
VEQSSRWLLALVIALLMIGVVMVYSAKTVKSARMDSDALGPLLRHAIKVCICLVGMIAMMRFDYRVLGRHYGKILLVTVLLLLLVLIPGVGGKVNGARRWFVGPGFMLQPSEFAKLALIIVVSSFMVRAGERIKSFSEGLLPSLVATGVICMLILSEPDFGTTVICGCLVVTLLVIGGVRIQHFCLLTLVMMPLLFYYAYNKLEHVRDRVASFMASPAGGQVDFSLMALSSGGMAGTGLGGSQCKLYFIPECESDFIFSIIGEELGFIGTSLVVLLFIGIIFHGIRILMGIKNRFGFLLATGILLLISTQALVNMAVVMGLAPTKGLPLPFISSGGSSMIALLMGVGLLLNIAKNPDLASVRVQDEFCEAWYFRFTSFIKPIIAAGGKR